MQKVLGMILIVAGMAVAAQAATVPEIDPTSSAAALGLLAGVLLVIRSRRKQ